MERKHKELLSRNRESFLKTVDIDNLLPYFQATSIVSTDDVIKIGALGKMESKVEMFLDILPDKGPQAFHTLCAALEITYPHLLRNMFLGASSGQVQSIAMTTKSSGSDLNATVLPTDSGCTASGGSVENSKDKLGITSPSLSQSPASSSSYSSHYTITSASIVTSQSHSTPNTVSSYPFSSWSPAHSSPHSSSSSYSASQAYSFSQAPVSPPSHSASHTLSKSFTSSHSTPQHSSVTKNSHPKPYPAPISSIMSSPPHASSHSQSAIFTSQPKSVMSTSAPPAFIKSPVGSPMVTQPLLGLPASDEGASNNSGIGGPRSPYLPATRPLSFHDYTADKHGHGHDDRLRLLRQDSQDYRSVTANRKSQPVMGDSLVLAMGALDDMMAGKSSAEDPPNNMLVPVSNDKPSGHNIDWLKSQCDLAMNELQSMKQQLGDTVKKCDLAMTEADMYRQHYNSANEMLHKLRQENSSLKSQCSDLAAAEQRLRDETKELRKVHDEDKSEINELRKQQWQVMSGNESFEGFNIMYDTAVSRYESLKTEHEALKKQLMDAMDAHRSSARNVELLQEEKGGLQRQVEELTQERNSLSKERKLMQQHMTSAIQASAREKTDLTREVQSAKKECDELKKLMHDALADKTKTNRDVMRIRSERDAMVQEYTLVMSERDTVHKEIEQLQDKLSNLKKQADKAEKEKKSLQEENTAFKLQLSGISQERDRALEDLKLVRLKYEGQSDVMRQDDPRSLMDAFRTESRTRTDADSSMGSFENAMKRIDSKEIDTLRKEVEKQKAELEDALREAADSKRDRDWAFGERDKIVRERESIKALCDKLRHERDNAVSKLIEAVRDSDELKKQKNESQRELKELKEKYESLVEKEARKNQLNSVGNTHSRDSAIDTDMQEWEVDTLELDMGELSSDDLGFDLVGGRGDQLRGESEVFVGQVRQDSRAYGVLRANDLVVKVNEVGVNGLDAGEVEQTIYRAIHHSMRTAGSTVRLVVRRKRRVTTRAIFPVHIAFPSSDRDLGVSLEHGIYVSRILPGSAAAKEGSLAVGDRILGVNSLSVETANVTDVMQMIQDHSHGGVVFNVLRYCPTPSASLANSSSMSSGHLLTESSPEVPSLSPRSPHSSHWISPSPESTASSSQYKGLDGVPLKSSGSQTDSLDSPRTRSPNITSPDEYSDGRIPDCQPIQHHKPEKKGLYERNINSKPLRIPATARRDRDARSKSGHPFMREVNDMDRSMEDEAIDELNAIINQYTSQPSKTGTSAENSKPRQDRRKRSHENGTWPKCRSHVDFSGSGFHPPVVHKERPGLSNAVTYMQNNTNQSTADDHMPPTPPERTDSFKRSASIKHSPQSSDSTVKYSYKKPPQVTNTVGHLIPQQSYESSSKSYKTSKNSSFPSQHEFKTQSDQDNGDGDEKVSTMLSHHYPRPIRETETRTAYPETGQATTDYSVVSGNQKDLLKYIPRKQTSRPTSAPSRSRKGHRELANSMHSNRNSTGGEFLPQKPGSLDIQPMYSPRPLPHTGGQHIPPSNGHSLSPTQPISPLSVTPAGSGKPGKTSASDDSGVSTVTGFAQRKLPPGNYPISRLPPSSGEMIQYYPPVYHQIATVWPHQGSQSPSHSALVTSPGYNSPPPGYSSISPPVPELDADLIRGTNGHYSTTPSPSPSIHSSSTPLDASILSGGSDDFPYHHLQTRGAPPARYTYTDHIDGNSTFPHNAHHRRPIVGKHMDKYRLPPSQSTDSRSSVDRGRLSGTASYEAVSDRSSPISQFMPVQRTIDYHQPAGTSQTLPKTAKENKHRKPRVGQKRNIKVEKSQEPLGIQIDLGSSGGIFVSSVSENSLAARNGISVADQLLEVCGINMRTATREEAAMVLRQCGGSVSMLVQYNPDKYLQSPGSSGNSSDDELTSTPASLRSHKKSASHHVSNETITPETCSPQTLSPSTLSPSHSVKTGGASSMTEDTASFPVLEQRYVLLKKHHNHDNIGITLAGGNAVGIFVRSVLPSSVANGSKGLRSGDQLLEVNRVSLRSMTVEQAALELSKPADTVSILCQYNIQKYNKISEQPGDAFYIRAMFDRRSENDGELSFRKDNILFVDNTLYQGNLGTWRAWLVDDEGNKYQCGTIPCKDRLDEELAHKRSLAETGDDLDLKSSRRGSGSARRSFFRRRKHQRNNSKDSRELNSFSDASINSDSVPFLDDGSVLTFERVDRLDSAVCRPVFILGPHATPIINKLASESPDRYCICKPEIIDSNLDPIEEQEGYCLSTKALPGDKYEVYSLDSVKNIMEQNCHCMLSIPPESIETLHKLNIYPIVLFLKHKSPKQIREVRDMRFLPEKMSNKTAKEYFETYQEYEQKYKRFFSDCITGGNLAYMCCKIKQAIEREQRKTIWVPCGSL